MFVGFAYNGKFCGGFAKGIFLPVDLALAAHFGAEIFRQGVDAADAYAVQTARYLVGAFVELAAGMKHCEHHFKSAFMLFLMHVHGYAAAIVDHGD